MGRRPYQPAKLGKVVRESGCGSPRATKQLASTLLDDIQEGFLLSASVIDPHIIQAYGETHFHVFGDMPTTLCIGHADSTLLALHLTANVSSSAFITACNPHSHVCDPATNVKRQEELAKELRAGSFAFIDGIGKHPSDTWPGEASFLVFGLSLEATRMLGMRHQQNAVVWCDADAIPQLILLR